MALAAIGFAKAKRRRQIMVARRSIGPGATNMVTAAAVAHANRLPVLLLAGDTFANRIPDPVLQQVEHFGDPTITRQRRLQAGHPLLGPHHPARADHLVAAAGGRDACSTRPIAARPSSRSAQDVQAEAYDYPGRVLRADASTASPRRGPTRTQLREAATLLRKAKQAAASSPAAACTIRGAERGARRLRRAAQHPGRRDHRRPHRARPRPSAAMSARSASSARPRPMRWRPRPTSCWRSARGCRISPPARGRCSPPDARIIAPQRRPLRRGQAPRAAGRRRRPGRPRASCRRRSATGARPTPGRSAAQANTPTGTRCVDKHTGPDQRRGAELCPGGRRGQPHRPSRPTSR